LIAGQAGSGASIRDWCRRHGVSEPSFYFWRRELARRKQQHQGSGPQVVPVEISPSSRGSSTGLEIELPGRVIVRVGPGCDADLLRQTLALLSGDDQEAEPC
jgi:transposase-like protein